MTNIRTVADCMPSIRHERYQAAYSETLKVFEKHKLTILDCTALLASLQYTLIKGSFEP